MSSNFINLGLNARQRRQHEPSMTGAGRLKVIPAEISAELSADLSSQMAVSPTKPIITDDNVHRTSFQQQLQSAQAHQLYGSSTTPTKVVITTTVGRRTPKTPGSGRKRGRPSTKHIPGAEDPWMAHRPAAAPVPGQSSELGSMPPSLAMLTSSPIASPGSASKGSSHGRLSSFKVDLRPKLLGNNNVTESVPGSCIMKSMRDASSPFGSSPISSHGGPSGSEKLRGLSINDIPSSPVQGFHINFHEGHPGDHEEQFRANRGVYGNEDEADYNRVSNESPDSSLISTPTRKRPRQTLRTRSLTTSPKYADESAVANSEAETETGSQGFRAGLSSKSHGYIYGPTPLRRAYSELSYDIPSTYTASVSVQPSFGRRISLVISNGHASLSAEAPPSEDTCSDKAEAEEADPGHVSVLSASASLSPTESTKNKTKTSTNTKNKTNESTVVPDSRFHGSDPTPTGTALGLLSWDLSDEEDSDVDSDFQGSDFYTTAVANEKAVVIAGDAMTAFTRTIARTRATSRNDERPGRNSAQSYGGHYGGNYGGSDDYNYSYQMIHTPFIQSHSFKHSSPQHFSLTRSPSHTNNTGAINFGSAILGATLNAPTSGSTTSSFHDTAATPPGSMLVMDDSAFSTGMTPYLPSRSQNFRAGT